MNEKPKSKNQKAKSKKMIAGTDSLRDHNGYVVPVAYIPEHDLSRHVMVEELVALAKEIEIKISELKSIVASKTDKFINKMIADSELDPSKFKGNITLFNFDKTQLIEVNTGEFVSFNEKISIARGLINQCLEEWTKGSRKELCMIVNRAFQTDRKGFLDSKRIMELLSYDIEDDRWIKAMETIKDSITVTSRKKYYKFKVKGKNDDWDRI